MFAAPALELLGICFWRKGREERNWVEFMGEKGGFFLSVHIRDKKISHRIT